MFRAIARKWFNPINILEFEVTNPHLNTQQKRLYFDLGLRSKKPFKFCVEDVSGFINTEGEYRSWRTGPVHNIRDGSYQKVRVVVDVGNYNLPTKIEVRIEWISAEKTHGNTYRYGNSPRLAGELQI